MNHKTLYLKCLCGRNKALAYKYQQEGYKVKITSNNVDWRREAATYNTRPPFIVVDGRVTKL